jgi:hypothetical protein
LVIAGDAHEGQQCFSKPRITLLVNFREVQGNRQVGTGWAPILPFLLGNRKS